MKLSPGCWIAHAFAAREFRGEACSIEFLRAVLETAPTWPEAWTPQEGYDYARMMEGR